MAINLADPTGSSADVTEGAVRRSPARPGCGPPFLGLALTRLNAPPRHSASFNAPSFSPNGAIAHVYAVGLHSAGRGGEASDRSERNLARRPGDRETLLALISFSRDAGDVLTALDYAERLATGRRAIPM